MSQGWRYNENTLYLLILVNLNDFLKIVPSILLQISDLCRGKMHFLLHKIPILKRLCQIRRILIFPLGTMSISGLFHLYHILND